MCVKDKLSMMDINLVMMKDMFYQIRSPYLFFRYSVHISVLQDER